jgi:hypothetical protein
MIEQTQLPFDSRASQKIAILRFLQEGNRITPLLALEKFKCMRLGGRCFELRKEGYNIKSEMVKVPSGKRVKSYWLEAK